MDTNLLKWINPHALCAYLERMGWKNIPRKDQKIKAYQNFCDQELVQVTVPLDKSLGDYQVAMYQAIDTISYTEYRDMEEVLYDVVARPGSTVLYHGNPFITLGIKQGGILAVAEHPLDKKMPFNENETADWKGSTLRPYLNGEYLEEIGGSDGLLRFVSNLKADDGTTEFGVSEDYVFLLSDALYREYRKFIPQYNSWWWTITPWASGSAKARFERVVSPSGALYHEFAFKDSYVVPCVLLNPEKLDYQGGEHGKYVVRKEEEPSITKDGLSPGTAIVRNGHRFVVLGQKHSWDGRDGVLVTATEAVDGMPFDENTESTGDWGESTLRYYLNRDYLKEIGGSDGLLSFRSTIDRHGGCLFYKRHLSRDFVFLPSVEMHSEYKDVFPERRCDWWTLTPEWDLHQDQEGHFTRDVDCRVFCVSGDEHISKKPTERAAVFPCLLLDPAEKGKSWFVEEANNI